MPHYYARSSVTTMVDIVELQDDGSTKLIAHLSNRGDRLQTLLRLGIPLMDAKRLLYEMSLCRLVEKMLAELRIRIVDPADSSLPEWEREAASLLSPFMG